LLDSNHLSAYLDRQSALEKRIDAAMKAGDRFGICVPVHCEYRAGIRLGRRFRQNLIRLQAALQILRIWPTNESTAVEFAELTQELRAAGKAMSQFDLLIAAISRQHNLTILTADQDFRFLSSLKIENWL
jgi:predicted nucleic acid-binding protein